MNRLISIICILVLCAFFTGCGTQKEIPVVKDALDSSLNDLLTSDVNDTGITVSASGRNGTTQAILNNVKYEIKDIEIDDSQATAIVVVDSPDVIQILQNSAATLDSVTDLLDALNDSLSTEYPEKTYTVEVTLQKNGNTWEVIPNEELMNALYGGLIEEGQRILSEILENLAGVAENG